MKRFGFVAGFVFGVLAKTVWHHWQYEYEDDREEVCP